MEKDGKLTNLFNTSNTVPLRCKNESSIKRFVLLVMTSNRSTNVISPKLTRNFIVARGVSNCPFATRT